MSVMMKRKRGNTPAQNQIQQTDHIKHNSKNKVLLGSWLNTMNALAFSSLCVSWCWHWCYNNVWPPHVFEVLYQWDLHPYPHPWPLIQTLVIWPAVAWLMERHTALHFHSFPHSLTFPQPHSNPTVTHIDSKPCYSPLLTVTQHTIKVLVMMFNNKQQRPHLAQLGLEPTENLQ